MSEESGLKEERRAREFEYLERNLQERQSRESQAALLLHFCPEIKHFVLRYTFFSEAL